MLYFIISTSINALVCGSCCILVLVNNYKSKIVRNFALFNCTVALWSFFYLLSMLATRYDEAHFYSYTLNYIALFIPPAFLGFCIEISENKSKWSKRILFTFLLLDLAILPFASSPLFIKKMAHILIFPFWPVPGPMLHFSIIQFSILVPIAFYLLRGKIIISYGEEKKQLNILFFSLLVGFLGGSTDYLPCLGIPIIPYGNAFVSFFVFGFVYLIFKYHILEINVALSRSFVYAIIIFLISVLYFATTHITEIYLNELTGYKSFIFSVLCASITALAFVPLQNLLQKIIDKLFLKKSVEEIELENKLLRQEVIQTERLKAVSILASGMAHEIKNPLTVLKTFSEYLPKRLDDKEFLLKYAAMINSEVNRIDNIVHELLDFAKPAAPVLTKQNIHGLIDSTLEFLNNDCIKKHITIHKDYSLPLDTQLELDLNQIKQVFLNIFLNAIDAMPHGGKLMITTGHSLDAKRIQIRIRDTGIGIDPKDLPNIFNPFFTKKDGGTGLGLAITHEIIRNHKGKITVESVVGQGSVFILDFPLI